MKNIKKLLCIILIVTSIFTMNIGSVFADDNSEIEINSESAQMLVKLAMSIVSSNYKFDITNEELYRNTLFEVLKKYPEAWETAFEGIFNNLDENSEYFDKEEFESFTQDIMGEICGIGVGVMEFSEGLMITRVYSDSPAYENGLATGDIIVAVDGKSIAGMDISIAQKLIVGEVGTKVKITYKRDGKIYDVILPRRQIAVESGRFYTLENDTIGYIQLYSFDEHSAEFVKSALAEFDKKNIKNIIMDLRNNPRGSLSALTDVCQNFIPKGPIVHIEYKNQLKNYQYDSTNKKPKYDVIVLVNKNSASASEAFAGAVQDTGVGIVIGEQTYGKGTMQNITKFKIGGGIKLTEAVYLTPNKRNIHKIGIEPDLKIKEKQIPYEDASYLIKIKYDRELKLNDKGSDVYAMKQRFELMGYNMDMSNDIFDNLLDVSVKKFQETNNLPVNGVLDILTQTKVEGLFFGQKIPDNAVELNAIEIFNTGTIDEHKHIWSPDDYLKLKR